MGDSTERDNARYSYLTREAQDAWSCALATSVPPQRKLPACSTRRSSRSSSRSAKATPSPSPEDEGIRPDTTAESLAGLRPRFRQGRHHHRRLRIGRSPMVRALSW
jgi:acetyl-CoA C-acetyltransferase